MLLDDNFASIVTAVHEGRTVYDNIRKVTAWTVPINGGEALTVIAAILSGFAMPMTPAQILWINMILTITLGLVLAFEPPEPGVMRRPPRPAAAGLMTPFLIWRMIFVSLLFVAGALSIFFYALGKGLDLATARTMVVIAVGTMVVAQLAFTYWPVMNTLFASKPVALADGLVIITIGAAAMIVLGAEKYLICRVGLLTAHS